MNRTIYQGATIFLFSALLLVGGNRQPKEPTLAECLKTIQSKQFVDLTHSFEPGIPHWPGFPDEKRETVYWYDEGGGSLGKGFFAQQLGSATD